MSVTSTPFASQSASAVFNAMYDDNDARMQDTKQKIVVDPETQFILARNLAEYRGEQLDRLLDQVDTLLGEMEWLVTIIDTHAPADLGADSSRLTRIRIMLNALHDDADGDDADD